MSRNTLFVLVLFVLGATLFGWAFNFVGIPYQRDIVDEATKLVGALVVVTTFVERATAVLGSIWYGQAIAVANAKAAVAEMAFAAEPDAARNRPDLETAWSALAKLEADKSKLRAYFALFIGLAVSAAGVRTLERLQDLAAVKSPLSSSQLGFYHSTDILITAGLIAGGSAGIAAITALIGKLIDRTRIKVQLDGRARP